MPSSPTFFVLGADVQDASNRASLDIWHARGLNTLVRVPDSGGAPPTPSAISAWSDAAVGAGFHMIRQAPYAPGKGMTLTANQVSANAADAAGWNGMLLAWTMPDEPSNTPDGFNSVFYTPAELQSLADQLRRAKPNIPLFESHVGTHITPDWAPFVQPTWHAGNARNLMQDYMQGSEADWLASATYEIQDSQPLFKRNSSERIRAELRFNAAGHRGRPPDNLVRDQQAGDVIHRHLGVLGQHACAESG